MQPLSLVALSTPPAGCQFDCCHPHQPASAPAAEGDLRRELGGVRFEYNVLGTRGPRKMVAVVPAVDPTGEPYIFRPEVENDSILDR